MKHFAFIFYDRHQSAVSDFVEWMERHGGKIVGCISINAGACYAAVAVPESFPEGEEWSDAAGRRGRIYRMFGTMVAMRYVETFGEFLARCSPKRRDELDPAERFH